MNLAMLLSCTSFEGFFGGVQGRTRDSYLASYRNDWAWYYAAGLLENGIRPVIYIPSLRESGRYETDEGIAVRFLPLARWYRPMEIVTLKRIVRRQRWLLYGDERLNAVAFMDSLREGLATDGIDHLYVQEYWSGRFDHLARRVELPVSGADHGGLADGVVKAFKRGAMARAAFCTGQTRDECREIERFGGRARLQPNGCDVERFSPGEAPRMEKTILTVARLTDRQKRTSDLLRALALLPEDWRLDIVGTGPDREKLEALAVRLGVAARTRFHGFQDRDAVRERLRSCGVYAMPSSNEAVAIAALEAMGCGASLVLTRIRAFEEMVEDGVNGALVPVGDVPALAGAILEAFENRQARGLAARRTALERFDTRRLYRQLADALREVTPAARAPAPAVSALGPAAAQPG